VGDNEEEGGREEEEEGVVHEGERWPGVSSLKITS